MADTLNEMIETLDFLLDEGFTPEEILEDLDYIKHGDWLLEYRRYSASEKEAAKRAGMDITEYMKTHHRQPPMRRPKLKLSLDKLGKKRAKIVKEEETKAKATSSVFEYVSRITNKEKQLSEEKEAPAIDTVGKPKYPEKTLQFKDFIKK